VVYLISFFMPSYLLIYSIFYYIFLWKKENSFFDVYFIIYNIFFLFFKTSRWIFNDPPNFFSLAIIIFVFLYIQI